MAAARRRSSAPVTDAASADEPPFDLSTSVVYTNPVTDRIVFHVRGLPIAQGSTRSWVKNGRPVITSTSKGLGAWRRLVADVAQAHAPPEPWEGPVAITLDFGLPKPKSAPKRRRVWPAKRPDLDKLTRSVLDALTYVIFSDDCQVVEFHVRKEYGPPGVIIEVCRIRETIPTDA